MARKFIRARTRALVYVRALSYLSFNAIFFWRGWKPTSDIDTRSTAPINRLPLCTPLLLANTAPCKHCSLHTTATCTLLPLAHCCTLHTTVPCSLLLIAHKCSLLTTAPYTHVPCTQLLLAHHCSLHTSAPSTSVLLANTASCTPLPWGLQCFNRP